jgi:ABC-type sugar transport system ATPase subunit
VALEVQGLAGGRQYREISFAVRRGEVVGMFGIIGAGRTEIARALFRLDPPDAGEIRLDGRRIAPASPAEAVAAGLALVPEDRQRQGLVLSMSEGRNLSLAALPRLARAGRIDPAAELRLIAHSLRRLAIRPPDPEVEGRSLSGGNQQKVVLARWLATRPSLLILDEPTRGIDIGTKREVHALIRQLAADGLAVLLISSELEEALSLAHRLLVLRAGRITAELDARSATAAEVMACAV